MASPQNTPSYERLAHSHRVCWPLAVQAGPGASGHYRAPVHGDDQQQRGGLVAVGLFCPWLAHTISRFSLPPEASRRSFARADSARLDCLATESRDDSRSCSAALDLGRRGIEQIVSEMIRTPNKVTGANSRPALQFESRGLRRHALVVESHGRYHGGAAVAQFCRWAAVG